MSRLRLALAAGCALALSACSLTTEVATQREYAAGEGARLELGESIDIENIFLLTSGSVGDAYLYGLIDNNSDEDVTVNIKGGGDGMNVDESFDIEPRTVHNFGSTDAQEADEIIRIPGNFEPGSTIKVTVSGGGESEDLYLPVLTACTADYEEIFPGELQCPERETPKPKDH